MTSTRSSQYLFIMRPTPRLESIALGARRSLEVRGDGDDLFSMVAGVFLCKGAELQSKEAQEAGEAFGDERRAEVLATFSRYSPLGFVFSLPQVIEDNLLNFDDEEALEKAVLECFECLGRAGETDGAENLHQIYADGEAFVVGMQ